MKQRLLAYGTSRANTTIRESFAQAMPRALALFLGGFAVLNIIGDFFRPGFSLNLWWIDLRALPEMAGNLLIMASGLCLLGYGLQARIGMGRCAFTLGSVGMVAVAALWNTLEFYALYMRGVIHPLLPVPLSLLVLAVLCFILRAVMRSATSNEPGRSPVWVMAIFAACVVAFPLAQMMWFGKTDYRRPADVAVVFGARAYADGRPSDALADRVKTACQLYRDGLVRKLIFSGGPGDGSVHETEAMRRLAVRLGVPAGDILTDTGGLNTEATVKNTRPMLAQLNAQRILVVSHFYHLPRVKLAYQHAGLEVYTVPAKESYFLKMMPYFMVREVAAVWSYYLHPLIS